MSGFAFSVFGFIFWGLGFGEIGYPVGPSTQIVGF